MKSHAIIRAFVLTALACPSGITLASAQEFTAFECIPVNNVSFRKEVTGVGSSCALVGRKKNAEKRALDSLEAEAEQACEAVRDSNPEIWDVWCQSVCEFNGYDDYQGTAMCSYDITDTDTWEESGCFVGDRQYNSQEADVQCGCFCTEDL